jgi:BMFP domain-containing protein YqiC
LILDPDLAGAAHSAAAWSNRILEAKSSGDFKIGECRPMRVLIVAFSVLFILVGADAARAGLSTADRELAVSVEPVTFTDEIAQESTQESTQITEDQIDLDKAGRRDVQRWLTGLGFVTRANGKFDDKTRAVIARWQDARGYPRTGFLDATQHQALMSENVAAAHADLGGNNASADHPAHRRDGARHRPGGVGGPVGLIGGLVGGLFGR